MLFIIELFFCDTLVCKLSLRDLHLQSIYWFISSTLEVLNDSIESAYSP